jgi:hypothetical protein
MSLIRDAYRDEILGGLADAGEHVVHVFLEVDAGVLRERLNARVTQPGRTWDQAAHEIGMTGVDEIVAAAARQPGGTLMLRSDKLTPAELADEVMAAAGLDQKLSRRVAHQRSRCITHQMEPGNGHRLATGLPGWSPVARLPHPGICAMSWARRVRFAAMRRGSAARPC